MVKRKGTERERGEMGGTSVAQTDELSPVGLPSISPHLLTPVLIKSTEMRTISLTLFSLSLSLPLFPATSLCVSV